MSNDLIQQTGLSGRIREIFLEGIRPYFWILLACLILYFRSSSFSFVDFDDKSLIVDSLKTSFSLSEVKKILTTDIFTDPYTQKTFYRPVMNLSLFADALLFGKSAPAYHTVNYLLHALFCMLLFAFMHAVTSRRAASFILTMMFLANPFISYAVFWIPGRNDIILGIFVILSFLMLGKALERKGGILLPLSSLMFFFALVTKETALVAFPMLVWYIFLKKKDISRGELVRAVVIYSVPVLFWVFLRLAFDIRTVTGDDLSVIARSPQILYGMLNYLACFFIPYGIKVFMVPHIARALAGVLIIFIALFFIQKKLFRDSRPVYFGIIWFILFLAPTYMPNTFLEYIMGQRAYLPALGILLVLSQIDTARLMTKKAAVLAAMLLFLFYSSNTVFFSSSFEGSDVFWKNAVTALPDKYLMRKYYGNALLNKGDIAAAEKEYLACLELKPGEPFVHNNLGRIYMTRGDRAKAKEEFIKETMVSPMYQDAYFNLGVIYYKEGDMRRAMMMWTKVLEIDPSDQRARHNLEICNEIIKRTK